MENIFKTSRVKKTPKNSEAIHKYHLLILATVSLIAIPANKNRNQQYGK